MKASFVTNLLKVMHARRPPLQFTVVLPVRPTNAGNLYVRGSVFSFMIGKVDQHQSNGFG